ncbi:hypothetical protein CDV31_008258 [Fusarium ambrosium]|uniref:AB hydrolase-1 domain-containing protein n=1 Tax=Fusarium ambrosium TaxID=131363 RepID=A0A428U1R9_9HYPO|nr:hypothetical protein CDV31_008258 [Fusarium ambrosium]
MINNFTTRRVETVTQPLSLFRFTWELPKYGDLYSQLGGRYRYVIYDTRSYGRSSKPEDAASYSVERHALDLKSLLTALDINKPVILVTHSMGCNIASAFCLSNSAQVRGMVQVGAHYDGKQLAEAGYTVDVFCGKAPLPSEAIGFYMRLGLSKDVAIEATKWPA